MIKIEACPQCGSRQYKRNGRIHTGKQNHKCKACGRAFVLVPENHVITKEQWAVIERLLLERISLRGICRVIGVRLRWLLYFMVERFTAAPEHLYVRRLQAIQECSCIGWKPRWTSSGASSAGKQTGNGCGLLWMP
jgi:transposase-like protein